MVFACIATSSRYPTTMAAHRHTTTQQTAPCKRGITVHTYPLYFSLEISNATNSTRQQVGVVAKCKSLPRL